MVLDLVIVLLALLFVIQLMLWLCWS